MLAFILFIRSSGVIAYAHKSVKFDEKSGAVFGAAIALFLIISKLLDRSAKKNNRK